MTHLRHLSRPAPVTLTAAAAVLALAGCTSSGGSASTPTTSASALRGGGGAVSAQGARAPGVLGTVAAVDGTTLQVQGNGEQTAVVYSAKTTMTAQVATSPSALAVGVCVSVRTASGASTASASPTAANEATTLAATTVSILSSGGCDAVAGGADGFPTGGFPGGGTPPSGMPSGAPSGIPSGMPSGGPPGGRGFGVPGTIGEVTATSSGSFSLNRTMPARPGGGASTAAPPASASGTPVTVTYQADTSFLTTRKATAAAITVGSCVRATGDTDDTGTLTATTLALSTPTDGSCTSGVRGG